MKYPRYNINEFVGGHFEYTTSCPFSIMGKTNEVIMVGSMACQRCQYFKAINKEDEYVSCSIL